MIEQNEVITIKLLGREYQVRCSQENLTQLQEAASYLDAKMRESYEGGKAFNLDRFFMIAALNISNELITIKRQKDTYINAMHNQILEIQNKIEQALVE
jgi:cell division protein ZapA